MSTYRGPNKCCVYNCTNNKFNRPDCSFHRLPLNDSGRCWEWIINMGMTDFFEVNKCLLRKYIICSDHFEPFWFFTNLETKCGLQKRLRVLKDQAVPTVFNHNIIDEGLYKIGDSISLYCKKGDRFTLNDVDISESMGRQTQQFTSTINEGNDIIEHTQLVKNAVVEKTYSAVSRDETFSVQNEHMSPIGSNLLENTLQTLDSSCQNSKTVSEFSSEKLCGKGEVSSSENKVIAREIELQKDNGIQFVPHHSPSESRGPEINIHRIENIVDNSQEKEEAIEKQNSCDVEKDIGIHNNTDREEEDIVLHCQESGDEEGTSTCQEDFEMEEERSKRKEKDIGVGFSFDSENDESDPQRNILMEEKESCTGTKNHFKQKDFRRENGGCERNDRKSVEEKADDIACNSAEVDSRRQENEKRGSVQQQDVRSCRMLYKCLSCDNVFSTTGGLFIHIGMEHKTSDKAKGASCFLSNNVLENKKTIVVDKRQNKAVLLMDHTNRKSGSVNDPFTEENEKNMCIVNKEHRPNTSKNINSILKRPHEREFGRMNEDANETGEEQSYRKCRLDTVGDNFQSQKIALKQNCKNKKQDIIDDIEKTDGNEENSKLSPNAVHGDFKHNTYVKQLHEQLSRLEQEGKNPTDRNDSEKGSKQYFCSSCVKLFRTRAEVLKHEIEMQESKLKNKKIGVCTILLMESSRRWPDKEIGNQSSVEVQSQNKGTGILDCLNSQSCTSKESVDSSSADGNNLSVFYKSINQSVMSRKNFVKRRNKLLNRTVNKDENRSKDCRKKLIKQPVSRDGNKTMKQSITSIKPLFTPYKTKTSSMKVPLEQKNKNTSLKHSATVHKKKICGMEVSLEFENKKNKLVFGSNSKTAYSLHNCDKVFSTQSELLNHKIQMHKCNSGTESDVVNKEVGLINFFNETSTKGVKDSPLVKDTSESQIQETTNDTLNEEKTYSDNDFSGGSDVSDSSDSVNSLEMVERYRLSYERGYGYYSVKKKTLLVKPPVNVYEKKSSTVEQLSLSHKDHRRNTNKLNENTVTEVSKQYNCSSCDKVFITRSDVLKHEIEIHEIEMHDSNTMQKSNITPKQDSTTCYTCRICNLKFRLCFELKKHELEVHQNVSDELEAEMEGAYYNIQDLIDCVVEEKMKNELDFCEEQMEEIVCSDRQFRQQVIVGGEQLNSAKEGMQEVVRYDLSDDVQSVEYIAKEGVIIAQDVTLDLCNAAVDTIDNHIQEEDGQSANSNENINISTHDEKEFEHQFNHQNVGGIHLAKVVVLDQCDEIIQKEIVDVQNMHLEQCTNQDMDTTEKIILNNSDEKIQKDGNNLQNEDEQYANFESELDHRNDKMHDINRCLDTKDEHHRCQVIYSQVAGEVEIDFYETVQEVEVGCSEIELELEVNGYETVQDVKVDGFGPEQEERIIFNPNEEAFGKRKEVDIDNEKELGLKKKRKIDDDEKK